MPSELPTTAIALIGFIISSAGVLVYKMSRDFMLYIEKKNHNLERTTIAFLDSSEKKNKQFEIMLFDHDKRHGEMMDDMAARLEANSPINKKKL